MTKAERAAFVNVSGQQAWQAFRERLGAARTLQEAREVVRQSPGKDAAGGGLYANLESFLEKFLIPRKSNSAERVLYAELIRRLEQSGELTPERSDEIFQELGRAER